MDDRRSQKSRKSSAGLVHRVSINVPNSTPIYPKDSHQATSTLLYSDGGIAPHTPLEQLMNVNEGSNSPQIPMDMSSSQSPFDFSSNLGFDFNAYSISQLNLENANPSFSSGFESDPWNPLTATGPYRVVADRTVTSNSSGKFLDPGSARSRRISNASENTSNRDSASIPASGIIQPDARSIASSMTTSMEHSNHQMLYSPVQQPSDHISSVSSGSFAGYIGGPYKCQDPTCDRQSSTMSQHKKHQEQHKKIFLCIEQECPRSQAGMGFGTSNDLDRHLKSVHHINRRKTKSYKCFASGCPRPDKVWPRLDNFKQHLQRMHPDSDIDTLVQESEARYQQMDEDRESVLSHSTSHTEHTARDNLENPISSTQSDAGNNHRQQQLLADRPAPVFSSRIRHNSVGQTGVSKHTSNVSHHSRTQRQVRVDPRRWINRPMPQSTSNSQLTTNIVNTSFAPAGYFNAGFTNFDFNSMNQPKAATLAGGEDLIVQDMDVDTDVPSIGLHDYGTQHEVLAGINQSDPSANLPSISFNPPQDSQLIVGSMDITSAREHTLRELNVLLESFSFTDTPPDQDNLFKAVTNFLQQVNEDEAQTPVLSSTVDQKFICNVCRKSKATATDLRKHMIRHQKPYGCTFDTCFQKSGSKDDWQRHEESQHEQKECWRCNGSETQDHHPCFEVFYTRLESYHLHLRKDHGIINYRAIKKATESAHIPGRFQGKFWCGFCNRIQVLPQDTFGKAADRERVNHIVRHFRTEGKNIDQWVELGGHGRTKGEMWKYQKKESQASCVSDISEDNADIVGYPLEDGKYLPSPLSPTSPYSETSVSPPMTTETDLDSNDCIKESHFAKSTTIRPVPLHGTSSSEFPLNIGGMQPRRRQENKPTRASRHNMPKQEAEYTTCCKCNEIVAFRTVCCVNCNHDCLRCPDCRVNGTLDSASQLTYDIQV